jgi:hypothetical protein
MAYLDSAGNVDSSNEVTVRNWQEWTRVQQALNVSHVTPAAPATAVPSGAEKAVKGTH